MGVGGVVAPGVRVAVVAFSGDDRVRLLAHDLDFWIAAVTEMMQDRLRQFDEVDKGRCPPPSPAGRRRPRWRGPGPPRMVGQIWFGEDDGRGAVAETVQAADQTGRLRGILDAV